MALVGATLTAPHVHAHLDDHASEHHAADEVHAHIDPHADAATPRTIDRPRIASHPDTEPLYLKLFLAVSLTVVELPAAMSTSCEFAVPAERPSKQSLYVVHGHDPPALRTRPTRAPPPHLS
jgi:hypothetical protein